MLSEIDKIIEKMKEINPNDVAYKQAVERREALEKYKHIFSDLTESYKSMRKIYTKRKLYSEISGLLDRLDNILHMVKRHPDQLDWRIQKAKDSVKRIKNYAKKVMQ